MPIDSPYKATFPDTADGLYIAAEPGDMFPFVIYLYKGTPYLTREISPGKYLIRLKYDVPIELIGTKDGQIVKE